MSNDNKATIHFAENDFFIGVTPSGHAQTIETNSERASAATPMELVLLALGSCTGVDVISILRKSHRSERRAARRVSAQLHAALRQAHRPRPRRL